MINFIKRPGLLITPIVTFSNLNLDYGFVDIMKKVFHSKSNKCTKISVRNTQTRRSHSNNTRASPVANAAFTPASKSCPPSSRFYFHIQTCVRNEKADRSGFGRWPRIGCSRIYSCFSQVYSSSYPDNRI